MPLYGLKIWNIHLLETLLFDFQYSVFRLSYLVKYSPPSTRVSIFTSQLFLNLILKKVRSSLILISISFQSTFTYCPCAINQKQKWSNRGRLSLLAGTQAGLQRLASSTRGSSINSHQDGNGARVQTQRAGVTVVDLVGPKIATDLWVRIGYGRDAPSRGQSQNWVSAVRDWGGWVTLPDVDNFTMLCSATFACGGLLGTEVISHCVS